MSLIRMAGWFLASTSIIAVSASCGHRKGLSGGPDGNDGGPDVPVIDVVIRDAVADATVDVVTDATVDTAADAAADARVDASYHGFVMAKFMQDATGDHYTAFADFASGEPVPLRGCPFGWPSAGDCCCVQGIGTPFPTQPPDAATLTIATADRSRTLATLTPTRFVADGSTFTGHFYATSDLGPWWYRIPGDYPSVDSQPWNPGDLLRVAATGHEVDPFMGSLRTGLPLTGVTPAAGVAPIVIDRAAGLTMSWDPLAAREGHVNLVLSQFTTSSTISCFCNQLDAAGAVTVDPSLLGLYATEQLSGEFQLVRVIESTVLVSNAVVDLVGAVAVSGNVTFR